MIELQHVSKNYQSGKIKFEALKNINLTIKKGEAVLLFGSSGSGKTTLLNLIGAMDTPSMGKIVIDGKTVSDFPLPNLTAFRAAKIGFIFQNYNLIPALNVYENIVVPMKLKGQRFNKKSVLDLIEKVGLSAHIKHRPDELSGGQRQRVSIARSLVHDPPIIIADEPTANLDSKTAYNIIELLKELNKNLGVTIVFASHDRMVFENIRKKIFLVDGAIHYEKELQV